MPAVPRLSIVIPCPTPDERFEDTLVSVLQNRPTDCGVVLVFAGDYADPYDLRQEAVVVEGAAGAGLVELINLGLEVCRGDVVHLLQCGLQVQEGWSVEPLRRLQDQSLGAVAPLVIHRTADPPQVTAGVQYAGGGVRQVRHVSMVPRLDEVVPPAIAGPTLAAGFYRREAIRQVQGLDGGLGEELADIDLALALAEAGYAAVCEPASQVVAVVGPAVPATSFRQGSDAEYVFWKHLPARGHWQALAAHAALIAGELLQSLLRPRVASRLLGRIHGCWWRPGSRSTGRRQAAGAARRLPLPSGPAVRGSAGPRSRPPRSSPELRRHVA
jgi:hypothetical protein